MASSNCAAKSKSVELPYVGEVNNSVNLVLLTVVLFTACWFVVSWTWLWIKIVSSAVVCTTTTLRNQSIPIFVTSINNEAFAHRRMPYRMTVIQSFHDSA